MALDSPVAPKVTLLCILLCSLWISCVAASQAPQPTSHPVVVSSGIENGGLVYRVSGKRVEDSVENSLLTNLGTIVKARGTAIPVFIVIDVRVPFSEMGKLETALDKVDLTHRRLFVSDFQNGTMTEIHFDKAIPIPRN
jgi:hypothetical protein